MARTRTKAAATAENTTQAANGQGRDVMTLAEAAVYLRLPESEVTRLVFEQGLPGRYTGTDWRFLKTALQDWLRTPPPRDSREAFLAVAGAWVDLPGVDEMVEEISQRCGRQTAEDRE